MCMSDEANNRIEVWSNIVGQISLFFNGASLFSTCVAKVICADLFFINVIRLPRIWICSYIQSKFMLRPQNLPAIAMKNLLI